MICAVIDTNVFVSALLSHHSDAATVQVVEAISLEGIRPLYNGEILAEYEEVLGRTKFRLPASSISTILKKVKNTGIATTAIPSS